MLAVVTLTGCAEVSENPKTSIGALGGGAVGGLIAGAAGAGPAGIAAGLIGGGLRSARTRRRVAATAANTKRRSRSAASWSTATARRADSRTAAGTSRIDHGDEMHDGRREREMSDNHNPQTEPPSVTGTDAGIAAASDEHSLTVDPDLGARIARGLAPRGALVEADAL